VKLANGVLN